MKLRGNNMTVMYRVAGVWKAIAFGTSCEIDIVADVIETIGTESGEWKTYRKRKKGWRISTAHLMGNVRKNPDLFEMLDSKQPVNVCLTTVVPHQTGINAASYQPDGTYMLRGDALVTRMTITARKGDMVTMSAELQGHGVITVE